MKTSTAHSFLLACKTNFEDHYDAHSSIFVLEETGFLRVWTSCSMIHIGESVFDLLGISSKINSQLKTCSDLNRLLPFDSNGLWQFGVQA